MAFATIEVRKLPPVIGEMLYRHVETPEFARRFKWQAGSIAFWDKRAAEHHALWDYYPERALRPPRHGVRRQALLSGAH